MSRGTELGGIVVDERDKPIQGVSVSVFCMLAKPEEGPTVQSWLAYGENNDEDGVSVQTDEDGRWSINNAPSDAGARFRIQLQHPDYVNDDDVHQMLARKELDSQALRDKTARLVMQQGVSVRGVVRDQQGNIVDRGIVVLGGNLRANDDKSVFQINDRGEFELPPQPSGENRITVIAPDYAPQTKMIDIIPMMDELQTLTGRVHDLNGEPYANVRVIFEGIRLGHGPSYSVLDHTLVVTDESGRFTFPRLPPIRGLVRTIEPRSDRGDSSRVSIPLKLQAGETSDVDIGKGIMVRGSIRFSGEDQAVEIDFSPNILSIAPPTWGWPDGVAELNEYDWQGGWAAFRNLIDSGNYGVMPRLYLDSIPHYNPAADEQGEFATRIQQRGEYDLEISVFAKRNDSPGMVAGEAGRLFQRFVIDEAAIASGNLDLGEILVEANRPPEIGTNVEDFDFSVDGVTKSLSSLRGETVLLHFWRDGCDVCKADSDELKKLVETETDDKPRIKIVGLTIDLDSQRRRKGNPPDWGSGKNRLAATLTNSQWKNLNQVLGIWSLPRYVVIDAEGKLTFHGSLAGAVEHLAR